MNLMFLAEEVDVWDKIESFFDSIIGFFTTIGNAIIAAFEFLYDTISSLLEAVDFMAESVGYLTDLTSALPTLIATVFVSMLSLCIVFAVAGR